MEFDVTAIYNKMPDFQSHEEARSWFKEQFGDRFLLKNSDEIEGERVYYYHLVKDQEVYEQYMQSLSNTVDQDITSMQPFESYSTIEISEDGGISFSI
ncbi:hypothetical protein JCM9140_3985 [Halalkalibacter wakoensis JCM 9140]|uniref:Uncharacterized protein n=1 Tax=Halalkalibacter wakoensis JCM 9140 TaxID=1236970 RepID=W4Q8U2_9BACI|nr:hypothetical protein [Halalkalibacter wakoensis]GAE27824.1 hypothetical protein JCM9140_3985 [Halalkalibacter wakoensis JCM 9140]